MKSDLHAGERDREPVSNSDAHQVRILIVEDEYILAANLKEILESLGFTVSGVADSFESILEQVVRCCPDLVLMDIRLNGVLDGIDAARFLWNTIEVPIIYLTGHSDQLTLERAFKTLPFGYLLKPVNVAELSAAIAVALHACEPVSLNSTPKSTGTIP